MTLLTKIAEKEVASCKLIICTGKVQGVEVADISIHGNGPSVSICTTLVRAKNIFNKVNNAEDVQEFLLQAKIANSKEWNYGEVEKE